MEELMNIDDNSMDIHKAVKEFSNGVITLHKGDKFRDATITEVGLHTVQYKTDDGWSCALQTTWVSPTGELTWLGQLVQTNTER